MSSKGAMPFSVSRADTASKGEEGKSRAIHPAAYRARSDTFGPFSLGISELHLRLPT